MSELTNQIIDVINPITNEKLYEIAEQSDAAIDLVYQNARAAEITIQALSIDERIEKVVQLSEWILDNSDYILDKLIEETGKSRFDAYTSEIFSVCDVISYYKGHSKKILKEVKAHTPLLMLGKKSRIVYEPLGTILVITPWNYPFVQGFVPSILAFIAGNATIVKPSELTPLKGLWEKMLSDTNFPKDAIQYVYGGRITGSKLIDKRPDKIHFTGSVRAGKAIMAQAASQLIPLDLELGGKDPAIVFDDVNISRTVNGIMWGAFTTAGQSCTSIERLYVQDTIYDKFVSELVDKTKKLRTSNENRDTKQPEECDIGCITSPAQVKIIEEQIEEALEKGAKLLCGGIQSKGSMHMVPTILADVTHEMLVGYEETFGPVLAVMKFKTEAEAIALANDSKYGLSASVWSKDMKRAERVAKAIKTGNVSVNNHMLTEANAALPFGGIKDSGFGRYKGDHGLHTFSNSKSILYDAQSAIIDPHWYPFTKTKFDMLSGITQGFFRKSRNWIKFAANGLKADSIGKKEQIK
jgi:acyl-CoA reductase-like NAD-dependent aldehyde dehydrogenase